MRAISRSRLLRAVHLPVVSHFEMQNEFASATVSIKRDAVGEEAAKCPRAFCAKREKLNYFRG